MANEGLLSAVERCRVVPVLRVDSARQAGELARVLVAAGLDVLEVTLRTSVAIEVIQAIRSAVPGALVGAGTVLTADQAESAIRAGAAFIVSPGVHPAVLRVARDHGVPAMPGVATATEIGMALDEGITLLKFFPASVSGGLDWIKALTGPFPMARFVATGGIGVDDLAAYLAHPAVAAVGGSWMAPPRLVEDGGFDQIGRLAADAVRAAQEVRRADTRR